MRVGSTARGLSVRRASSQQKLRLPVALLLVTCGLTSTSADSASSPANSSESLTPLENLGSSVCTTPKQCLVAAAVMFCAVLQVALCIKNRNRWKPNLVPNSAQHMQPLQLRISAADAYAWLERWAANGAKWIVPSGCKKGQSGQTRGQGFNVGARFVTAYSQRIRSRSYQQHNRRSYTKYTTTTWDVLEADRNQCMVKFRSQTKAKTPGVVQMGNPGRGHIDCAFHFQNRPDGCVLVITSTMYSDTNADFVWWKNLLLIFWLIPPFQCIMCYLTFCVRFWHGGTSDESSRQAVIEQANKVVGQRISLALQSTVQGNGNKGMRQQSQQPMQQHQAIPCAVAHEVLQQPVFATLPGSMAMGSVVAVAPQPQMFQVQIPSGCTPGQLLTVQAPNGKQMQVSVPANGVPGQLLQVRYPNNTQPLPPHTMRR